MVSGTLLVFGYQVPSYFCLIHVPISVFLRSWHRFSFLTLRTESHFLHTTLFPQQRWSTLRKEVIPHTTFTAFVTPRFPLWRCSLVLWGFLSRRTFSSEADLRLYFFPLPRNGYAFACPACLSLLRCTSLPCLQDSLCVVFLSVTFSGRSNLV